MRKYYLCRYFATLQKELELYDCVLYEMVASRESLENRRNPNDIKKLKGSRSRGFNILGCIQRQMAQLLMLDFQLDCLDYQAENWYHADLDYETFKLLQVLVLSFLISLLLLLFHSLSLVALFFLGSLLQLMFLLIILHKLM